MTTEGQPVRKPTADADPAGTSTVLAYPLIDRVVIVAGIPILAVLVGFLLRVAVRWLLSLSPGLPMRPAFRLVGAGDRPWEIAIYLMIWLLLGGVVARAALTGTVRVVVSDTQLTLTEDYSTRTITREQVGAVFMDRKRLVVLDRQTREWARGDPQVSSGDLADALRRHGYPWHEADPYAQAYRLWVPDTPQLPAAANAVFAARATTLGRKGYRKGRPDAVRLREAVEALGFTVRDEGHRQYWRPLVDS